MKHWFVCLVVIATLLAAVPAWAHESGGSDNSSGSSDAGSGHDSGAGSISDNSSVTESGTHDRSSAVSHSVTNVNNTTVTDDPRDVSMNSGNDTRNDVVDDSRQDFEHQYLQNSSALQAEIHHLEVEHAQDISSSPSDMQSILEHQMSVKVGLDSFLLVHSQMNATIAPDISSLVESYNASLQNIAQAEDKIQKRDALTRLFVGGDDQAANELENEVENDHARIHELQAIIDQDSSMSPQVRSVLQQQLETMTQEQVRLSALAAKEHGDNGLFGWLFP